MATRSTSEIELMVLPAADNWYHEHVHPYSSSYSQPSSLHDTLDPTEFKPLTSAFTNTPLPWRPFYLRRWVLGTFAVAFLLILVAIEILVYASNKNNGIASSSSDQHYLWTFGPTALLTLVAAFWNRVDYQSKMAAPWIRLSQQNPVHPKRTLLLDYFSKLSFLVPLEALRNSDFGTFAAALTAIAIKVLIVISTGLLTLSLTTVNRGSQIINVHGRFVNDATGLNSPGTISYYVMQGLLAGNLTYPEGISKDYAFQSIQQTLSATAEVHAAVDGFQASLECQPVDLVMTGATLPDPHDPTATMNLTLTTADCHVENLRLLAPEGHCSYNSSWTEADGAPCDPIAFARFAVAQCDGTSDDAGKRVLVMFGNFTTYVDYSTNVTDYTGQNIHHPWLGRLARSTQMLCIPTYSMIKLDVVRNGTEIKSLTPSPGTTNGTLSSVEAWSVMAALETSYNTVLEAYSGYGYVSINISSTEVDVDHCMETALLSQVAPNTTATLLYDADFLQQVATGYYRQFAAIIAKQSLMEPASLEVLGSAILAENRLVVRSWAAHWMAGTSALCLLLTVFLIFTVPTRGILPCSPTTVPGMASLILHSQHLTERLRPLAAADKAALGRTLGTAKYRSGVFSDPFSDQSHFGIVETHDVPDHDAHVRGLSQIRSKQAQSSVLHRVSRVMLCLVLVGLIVALEVLLHKSTAESGIGDVGDDTFLHYTWTSIPALAFGALAMVFSSMDFHIRALAPYRALKQTVSINVLMTLDLLDMSIPRMIIKEITLRSFGACAATLAFLIASLFTIFTSSLFQALSMPTTDMVMLHANQSFPTPASLEDVQERANLLSSLILTSNLSYPSFTYGNLAFPELVHAAPLLDISNSGAAVLTTRSVVPALRSKMNCRAYDSSAIRTNHTRDYTGIDGIINPLGILIEGEECEIDYDRERYKYNQIFSTYPNTTYFALGSETESYSSTQGCSDMLWTWGKYNYTAEPAVQEVASMGCNVTFEVVDVDTTFVGTDLAIDPQTPPKPREDTARPSTLTLPDGQSFVYYGLADMGNVSEILGPFFAILAASPWAIPVSRFGDASAADDIRDAIKFQHGVILAQMLAQVRVPANTTNTTLTDPRAGDNDAEALYNATATDPAGRRRVVQDAVSTRILEALLGAAFVLLVLCWVLMGDAAMLASSPTAIASVVALVAGGNLLDLLPPDAASMSAAEIAASFPPGTRFWLGWGRVPDETGLNANGVCQFGIFAVRVGEYPSGPEEVTGKGGSGYVEVRDADDGESGWETATPGIQAPFFSRLAQGIRRHRWQRKIEGR